MRREISSISVTENENLANSSHELYLGYSENNNNYQILTTFFGDTALPSEPFISFEQLQNNNSIEVNKANYLSAQALYFLISQQALIINLQENTFQLVFSFEDGDRENKNVKMKREENYYLIKFTDDNRWLCLDSLTQGSIILRNNESDDFLPQIQLTNTTTSASQTLEQNDIIQRFEEANFSEDWWLNNIKKWKNKRNLHGTTIITFATGVIIFEILVLLGFISVATVSAKLLFIAVFAVVIMAALINVYSALQAHKQFWKDHCGTTPMPPELELEPEPEPEPPPPPPLPEYDDIVVQAPSSSEQDNNPPSYQ